MIDIAAKVRDLAASDPLVAEIEQDLNNAPTAFACLAAYASSLRASDDPLAPALRKLAKLFALAETPDALEGNYRGVALALLLSADSRMLPAFDPLVALAWRTAIGEGGSWVGKSFRRLDEAGWRELTGQSFAPKGAACLGVNHFRPIRTPFKRLAYDALSSWLDLREASPAERAAYGFERSGGSFVAACAPSVAASTPREVMALNFRWRGLRNRPPLAWLVDEVVQLSHGLYLGQIFFATKRLLSVYDPHRPPVDEGYKHAGYFVLWDQTWNDEGRRLFPTAFARQS